MSHTLLGIKWLLKLGNLRLRDYLLLAIYLVYLMKRFLINFDVLRFLGNR
jgi:hypothetical protein